MNTAPLSVSREARRPCAAAATWKLPTSAALNTVFAREQTSSLAWSSMKFKISTSVPSARVQCVMSACHRSFGICASNRTNELLGRFCG